MFSSVERLEASSLFDEETLKAIHFFNVEGLDSYLLQTGFKGVMYVIYGLFILFHAERGQQKHKTKI